MIHQGILHWDAAWMTTGKTSVFAPRCESSAAATPHPTFSKNVDATARHALPLPETIDSEDRIGHKLFQMGISEQAK